MRFRFKKLPKNSVLAVLFLGFIFLMAGVSFRRTLSAVDAMPKKNDTLRGVLSKTKGEINAVYGGGMLNFRSSSLTNKGTYIEVNGLMARLMGQRRMNGIVKLNNGHLADLRERIDTSPYVVGLKKLQEFCKSRNIEFLYVQGLPKICKYDKQLPAGFSDFSNENLDEFMSLVSAAGIEALDLSEELHKDGLDHYEAFFKTDHHWKPEAGFWAANKIRDYFVNKGILDNDSPDVSDLSNFNVDVYPDIFMGSYSKKVGANFGGLDDISLIYPKFYTNFRVTGKGINKSGSFKDVFFDMQHMATGFQKHPYTVYPNPLEQYFHFYNGRGINKKTIFWGGDSYGTVCAPFLSLSVENVIFGFYAYAGLIELIDNSNPDIVIILLNGRLPREHLVKLSEQFNDASY